MQRDSFKCPSLLLINLILDWARIIKSEVLLWTRSTNLTNLVHLHATCSVAASVSIDAQGMLNRLRSRPRTIIRVVIYSTCMKVKLIFLAFLLVMLLLRILDVFANVEKLGGLVKSI
jgi:hypothetical protein